MMTLFTVSIIANTAESAKDAGGPGGLGAHQQIARARWRDKRTRDDSGLHAHSREIHRHLVAREGRRALHDNHLELAQLGGLRSTRGCSDLSSATGDAASGTLAVMMWST